ncbi:MAG: serine hydrolase [Acidobacteria bacterium]|nr:serine hydrolase [Acidobacteriota bacterium]
MTPLFEAARGMKAAGIALCFLLIPLGASAQQTNTAAIQRIESGLLFPVAVAGEPVPQKNIRGRMERYGAPAVSVTVIDQHRIAWSRAYGAIREDKTPATPETLFQAASISKPVTAAAALMLVSRGTLDLDVPVDRYLSSWKIPESALTATSPITLRELLSHSAGISVHGFDGYEVGAPVPTLQQVLSGAPPANSLPIRVEQEPGKSWQYSGGGYTIVQQILEDVTGKPFHQLMAELVLDQLGMASSTFLQPLPERQAQRAATGYGDDGRPVAGRWHVYPEQAAAGLWTTASDLAEFALWVMADGNPPGMSQDREAARLLIARQPDLVNRYGGMGLGFFVGGEGAAKHFLHGGGNAGFRCYMIGFPATGQGVVIMTNSDSGIPLALEITRAVASEYQWPERFQRVITAQPVDAAQLAAYEGSYREGPASADKMSIEAVPEGLAARLNTAPAVLLRMEGEDRFVDPESGTEYIFSSPADGEAKTLLVQPERGNTRTMTRQVVSNGQ